MGYTRSTPKSLELHNTHPNFALISVSVSVISRKKSIEGTNKEKRSSEQTGESHVENKKQSSSKSHNPTTTSAPNESVKKIGLGSDISVTVVQKKKSIEGGKKIVLKLQFYKSKFMTNS